MSGHGKQAGKRTPDRPGAAAKCPICGKPPSEAYAPFCSKRCADIDLNRWLSGRYAIPGEPARIVSPDEDEGGE